MEEKYVKDHLIFETIVGSRAYGVHNEDSDYDKAGVMVPGIDYLFGSKRFEQYKEPGTDRVIYDIRKAINLIADNNPNMMDLLFMPERCIVTITPYWQKIINNRDLFISKRCRHTYSGYAIAQLNRIKTHRKYLIDPPKEPPERTSYGLSEVSIFPTAQIKAVCSAALTLFNEEDIPDFTNELDKLYGDYFIPLFLRYVKESERQLAMEWLQLGINAQAKTFRALGDVYLKEEYYDQALKEIAYYRDKKEWQRYCEWKKSRNKKRAELEEKFGYDAKHAMHLVRLIRCGAEILKTGNVNVDRTGIDAEELKEIRNGAWTYEKVEEYAHTMDEKLNELYKKTKLPKSVNREKIDSLCVSTVEAFLSYNQSI